MRKKLKPCPFCDGAAHYGVVGIQNHPDFGGHYIQCDDCKASTALIFPVMQDVDQQLADLWNTRA